jgi:hypothetical protein
MLTLIRDDACGLLILRRIPLPSTLSDALLEDRRVFLQRFSDLRGMTIPLTYTFFAIAGFGIGAMCCRGDGFRRQPAGNLASGAYDLVQSASFFYSGFGAREATHAGAFDKMVLAQGLGDADRQGAAG